MRKKRSLCYPEDCNEAKCGKCKESRSIPRAPSRRSVSTGPIHEEKISSSDVETDNNKATSTFRLLLEYGLNNQENCRGTSGKCSSTSSAQSCKTAKIDDENEANLLLTKHLGSSKFTFSISKGNSEEDDDGDVNEENETSVISFSSEDLTESSDLLEASEKLEFDLKRLWRYFQKACFRVYFGPSLDETAFAVADSAMRLFSWFKP